MSVKRMKRRLNMVFATFICFKYDICILQYYISQFYFSEQHMHQSIRKKSQNKFDTKIKNLQSKLKTLELPKLQRSKVDDLNKFLKDPTLIDKQQVSHDREENMVLHENNEPWMELTEDSEIRRLQKNIRSEINFLLADQMQATHYQQKSAESTKEDHKRVQMKLKKFQPTNSSFSLHYAQKKLDEEYHHKNNQQNGQSPVNSRHLPELKEFRSLSKPLNSAKAHFFYNPIRSIQKSHRQGIKRHNSEYENKLSYIFYTGQIENQSSEKIKGKLNKYTLLLQRKYNKFHEECQTMTGDVGNYKLQEQNDKDYRAKFLESLLNNKRL